MGRRRHSVLGTVLGLLLLVVVVYAVIVGVSAARILDMGNRANASMEAASAAVESSDFAGALDSVRDAAARVDEIEREAGAWWWNVAEYVPYLGEDVRTYRQLAVITDKFVNDGLMPVATQAEPMLDGGDGESELDLGKTLNQVGGLVTAVVDARAVVSECREMADALPASHFDAINEQVEDMRNAINGVDDAFSALESLNPLGNFDPAGALDSLAA